MAIEKSFSWHRTLLACFSAGLLTCVFNFDAAFGAGGDVVAGSSVIPAGPAVSFHGDAAIAHLKKEGIYDSLGEAMAATRYSINQMEGAAQSEGSSAYEALNPAHGLRTEFTSGGVVVRSSGEQRWQIGLNLKRYGYGQQVVEVPPIFSRHVSGNRIEYKRQRSEVGTPRSDAQLVEWYVNKPGGLEQGFTLSAPPRSEGGEATSQRKPLRLVMEWTGDLHAELTQDGQALLLKDAKDRKLATYDHLKAWDATGRELAARMQVSGRELSLEVDDAGAKYPVTIDPTFGQKQVQVKASDGAPGDFFGYSVAISGDTAVVGAHEDDSGGAFQGSAYVFVRNGETWTQQQKLVYDEDGSGGDSFGFSVAISGDTIIVGSQGVDLESQDQGAAYVYKRSGLTWVLQQELTASDGELRHKFGVSVALSGETAIVGTLGEKAYVFVRSSGTWSEQKILIGDNPPNSSGFGRNVAISGETAMVSGFDAVAGETQTQRGSVYFFLRTGSNWNRQQKTIASDRIPGDVFGTSIALGGDTAIVAYYNTSPDGKILPDYSRQGAYVYVRNSGTWSQQQKLAAGGPLPTSGSVASPSVAISGDTAIVGFSQDNVAGKQGQGSAYVYLRTDLVWSGPEKLTASDGAANDAFGFSVAISGENAVIGAFLDDAGVNQNQGSAYIFGSLPDVDDDGLADDWETNGITIDDDGDVHVGNTGSGLFIDLKAMGANPMHKDLFVHVDWMEPQPNQDPAKPDTVYQPYSTALKMVVDAFATAPVSNPDLKPGVRLHLDAGPDSIMSPGKKWGDLSKAGEVTFQRELGSYNSPDDYDWGEVDTIKEVRFTPARRDLVFRYALFCNSLGGSRRSGEARGIPGADFLVALGKYPVPGGTELVQAGTFMHELGHTLGLQHGGHDDINQKPNYLSIMNYGFQTVGIPLRPQGKKRRIDYSRAALRTLDETKLVEANGVSGPPALLTLWNKRTRLDEPAGANHCLEFPNTYYTLLFPGSDWDCDGAAAAVQVAADINGDGICVSPAPDGALHSNTGGDDKVIDKRITAGINRTCESVAACDPQDPNKCDQQEQEVGFVQPQLLPGFEDWPALIFEVGPIGKSVASKQEQTNPFAAAASTQKEPTIDQILDAAPPGLLEQELVAPHDVVTVSSEGGAAPLVVTFNGSASTAVNGTIVKWEWDFGDSTIGTGATVNHTYKAAGDYFASLTVTDNNGRVNLVPLLHLITVTGPVPANAPNLAPYHPTGWSDSIVVSKITGSNTDSSPLSSTDVLYVDWAVVNDGDAPTLTTFSTKLYVDGVQRQSLNTDPPVDPGVVRGVQDFSIGSLAAGEHTIRIQTDADGAIPEKNEADNAYTKIIVVSGGPTPTPPQRQLRRRHHPGLLLQLPRQRLRARRYPHQLQRQLPQVRCRADGSPTSPTARRDSLATMSLALTTHASSCFTRTPATTSSQAYTPSLPADPSRRLPILGRSKLTGPPRANLRSMRAGLSPSPPVEVVTVPAGGVS